LVLEDTLLLDEIDLGEELTDEATTGADVVAPEDFTEETEDVEEIDLADDTGTGVGKGSGFGSESEGAIALETFVFVLPVVAEPLALPPPPHAAVSSGAINTITAVVAFKRRCQFKLT
jgi:hypothetical protein